MVFAALAVSRLWGALMRWQSLEWTFRVCSK
jgi:hypothetical protein